MRVLVTGGAGFIGSHVVRHLLDEGHEPWVVDRLDSGRSAYLPDVPLLIADVREWERVVRFCRSANIVLHLAAEASVPAGESNPLSMAEDNVAGTVAALMAAQQLGAQEFRLASTAAVYGDPKGHLPIRETHALRPLSFYGLSKQSAETFVARFSRTRGFTAVILRLANVYGPGQTAHGEGGVVANFCERIVHRLPLVRHGDGEQTRDFIYVGDVARAFVHRLGRSPSNSMNVGTGQRTSVNRLGEILATLAGVPLAWDQSPPRVGDIRDSVFDPAKAKRWGFTFETALMDGLRQTLEAWA